MITQEENKKILEGIDWSFLNTVLESTDYTKFKDVYEILKDVYAKTFINFSLKYYTARSETEHMTKRIIEKNKTLELLNEQLKFFKERADESTIQDFGTKFLSKQDQTLA